MSSSAYPTPTDLHKVTEGCTTVKCQPSLSTFDCFTFTVLVTVVTKPIPHETGTIAAAVAGRSSQATRVCSPARHLAACREHSVGPKGCGLAAAVFTRIKPNSLQVIAKGSVSHAIKGPLTFPDFSCLDRKSIGIDFHFLCRNCSVGIDSIHGHGVHTTKSTAPHFGSICVGR